MRVEVEKKHKHLITCCSVCRKIQDHGGNWHKVSSDHYVSISARLTHSYCDLCFKEVIKTINNQLN